MASPEIVEALKQVLGYGGGRGSDLRLGDSTPRIRGRLIVGGRSRRGHCPDNSIEARVAAQMESIVAKRLAADKLGGPVAAHGGVEVPGASSETGSCPSIGGHGHRTGPGAGRAGDAPDEQRRLRQAGSRSRACSGAVTKLGTTKLRTFLLEASARKVFESRDGRDRQELPGRLEHSLAVAHPGQGHGIVLGHRKHRFCYLGRRVCMTSANRWSRR